MTISHIQSHFPSWETQGGRNPLLNNKSITTLKISTQHMGLITFLRKSTIINGLDRQVPIVGQVDQNINLVHINLMIKLNTKQTTNKNAYHLKFELHLQ